MTDTTNFPNGSCYYGFTRQDIERLAHDEGLARFDEWMRGQTAIYCPADHEECKHEPFKVAYYKSDIYRFVHDLPVID